MALCGVGGCLLYFTVMMLLPLAFLVIGSFMRRYGFWPQVAVYIGPLAEHVGRPVFSSR
jgi:hypothetical protein